MSVGKRLRQALALRDMSVRAFHREMSALGTHGSSYPTIHRYLKDATTPSVEFLRETAKLLEVREAWLISGSGAKSEEEEAIRQEAARKTKVITDEDLDAPPDLWVSVAMQETFPFLNEIPYDAMLELIGACATVQLGSCFKDLDEVVEALAAHLIQPFEWWKRTRNPDFSSPQFSHYVKAALLALEIASFVPDRD